ncbi:ciliary microtubule inner protein 2B isoform X2 [Rhineura floridana]|uniref:ciliary microtubule inner protein 2B isoform X2 n=1 Tax=Rhineura floridana TaxID=261503 RepID=UPI002AC84A76|nr:ciliary microtubule inner protein 2B isoform X2 [Rhineura floridana]
MATTFAPKVSQILMTPEPHYIPGYGGYCPRYKFMLGQTYGKLTSQLLTSAEAAHSGQLLLQPNYSLCETQEELPEQRERRRGGGKLPLPGSSRIPGYTGFIPRAQNHFAKTYSEICKEARSEFARQLARETGRKEARKAAGGEPLKDTTTPESKILTSKYKIPLAAVSKAAAPYVSRYAFRPLGSPYSLEDSRPQRNFIPGFTGFVPRAQYLIGASYPVITHRALVEFDQMRQKLRQGPSGSCTEAQGDGEALPPLAKTYPTDTGLLPYYKGYVPGYKFQFGHTYGHLTYNALGHSTLEKQMLDVLP